MQVRYAVAILVAGIALAAWVAPEAKADPVDMGVAEHPKGSNDASAPYYSSTVSPALIGTYTTGSDVMTLSAPNAKVIVVYGKCKEDAK